MFLLLVLVSACISQCIYILTFLLYLEDQQPSHCCCWEACIMAFTNIIL